MDSTLNRTNPFGNPDDWMPVEDAFDRWVAEAFPNDPLAKYGAGITLHGDGSVTVKYQGKEVKVISSTSNRT